MNVLDCSGVGPYAVLQCVSEEHGDYYPKCDFRAFNDIDGITNALDGDCIRIGVGLARGQDIVNDDEEYWERFQR